MNVKALLSLGIVVAFLAVFSVVMVNAKMQPAASSADEPPVGVVSTSTTRGFPTFEAVKTFFLGEGMSEEEIDQIKQQVEGVEEGGEPYEQETLAFESVYDAREVLRERGVTDEAFERIVAQIEKSERQEQGEQSSNKFNLELGYLNNRINAHCSDQAIANVWHTGEGKRWFTDGGNNKIGQGNYSCSSSFCVSTFTYFVSGSYKEHVMDPSTGTYGHTYTGCK